MTFKTDQRVIYEECICTIARPLLNNGFTWIHHPRLGKKIKVSTKNVILFSSVSFIINDDPKPKRQMGRPKEMVNGKRTSIYLSEPDAEYLKSLGKTVSGGIRLLIKLHNV
jgi:hypothetical protein